MAQNLKMMNLWKGQGFRSVFRSATKNMVKSAIIGVGLLGLAACSTSAPNGSDTKQVSRLDTILKRGT
jgi:hypothetical protein